LEGVNINPNFQHHIKLNLSVEYKKTKKKQANKENTRLANTTNNINIITNSRSLPAVTLQSSDNTSLINCMQQLQLNLTRSHLSPAGCNKTMLNE
jgi:hypothetical protein